MIKFNKVFNSKAISLMLMAVFLMTNIAYGIDLSEKPFLRKPLDFNDPNTTSRYLCVLFETIYRNCLVRHLSPEEAFAIVMRAAEELGIKVEKYGGGIRIQVYNDRQGKAVAEPWYRQKIDASKIVDDEFIRENHAAIIKMAEDIETAVSGMVKAYSIRDFNIEEYLSAWKVFEQICIMGVNGPEELEQFMFEFQFLSDESSNRVKDQWGYFNNSAIPKIRRLLKEMFADSHQEIINKDPLAFAVRLFVDFVREQPFHETNHRTADFLMNFILIKHGLPIFLLTPDNVIEYYQLTNTRNLQDENFNEASFKQIYAFFRREIENKARHIVLPARAVGYLSIYAPTVELSIRKYELLPKVMDRASRNSAFSSSI